MKLNRGNEIPLKLVTAAGKLKRCFIKKKIEPNDKRQDIKSNKLAQKSETTAMSHGLT